MINSDPHLYYIRRRFYHSNLYTLCRFYSHRGHYHRFMHKLRYDDPASNLNYTRIQKKLCQCSVRTVAIRCTQWKRYERADTRLLERRRNAMELRRNAKVAMRTPWKRRENVMISPSS